MFQTFPMFSMFPMFQTFQTFQMTLGTLGKLGTFWKLFSFVDDPPKRKIFPFVNLFQMFPVFPLPSIVLDF